MQPNLNQTEVKDIYNDSYISEEDEDDVDVSTHVTSARTHFAALVQNDESTEYLLSEDENTMATDDILEEEVATEIIIELVYAKIPNYPPWPAMNTGKATESEVIEEEQEESE